MGGHLTESDRYHIKAQLEAGKSKTEIAKKLKVHKSTISRELKRNIGRKGYRPKQAQQKASERWHSAAKAIKFTPEISKYVSGCLKRDWSPEQIFGRMKYEGGVTISPERIYRFVGEDKANGGDLWTHLRWSHRKRKKRYGSRDRRGEIPGRRSIEKRKSKANKRKAIGHLERDLILGTKHKGALLTAVDRKSRLTFAIKVNSKSAREIHTATVKILRPIKAILSTITNDNGKEFASHKKTEKRLGAKVYFTHPFSSYERGTNENTNGLLRQYFPKNKTDFTKITTRQVTAALNKLNTRPRKVLGYRTPIEVTRKELEKMKNVAFVI
jgi:IS30 family transposase